MTAEPAGTQVLLTRDGRRIVPGRQHDQGSFARVFRGYFEESQAPCALKVPRRELPDAPERLRAELELLKQVQHPRVVALEGWGEVRGRPFLVLEWLDGETLRRCLERQPALALHRALAVTADLLEGLSGFHRAGICHGDLRGENLMLHPLRGGVLIDPGDPVQPGEPPASAGEDLRRSGLLLHRMLTGREDGAADLAALGFRPDVVGLCTGLIEQRTAPAAAAAEARAICARL